MLHTQRECAKSLAIYAMVSVSISIMFLISEHLVFKYSPNFCNETIVVDCYSTSNVNSLASNGLECANGNSVSSWNGCVEQGSVRVRCPKDQMPCNDLAGNGIEFSCWHDCKGHGGLKNCFPEGTFCDRSVFNVIYG